MSPLGSQYLGEPVYTPSPRLTWTCIPWDPLEEASRAPLATQLGLALFSVLTTTSSLSPDCGALASSGGPCGQFPETLTIEASIRLDSNKKVVIKDGIRQSVRSESGLCYILHHSILLIFNFLVLTSLLKIKKRICLRYLGGAVTISATPLKWSSRMKE